MGWFLRLSCVVIIVFGLWFLWEWVTVYAIGPRPAPNREHRRPESIPAAYHPIRSVPALPVDDVAQRRAIEPGAQVVAEHVDGAVTIVVAGARHVRRNQHPLVLP